MKNGNKNDNESILYFQEFIHHSNQPSEKIIKEEPQSSSKLDTAEIFFELANAPMVGYKIGTNDIIIKQDNSCQSHTGGIVWETAYLLATYLCSKYQNNHNENKNIIDTHDKIILGKTLEVGSGCGMLGLILASSGLCSKVIMTETKDVMANLLQNVEYNITKDPTDANLRKKISVRQLRWDKHKKDMTYCQNEVKSDDLNPYSFDTIVGTDVIFTPSLVKPLLKTLRKMSHKRTNIYLCVQIRCEDSHGLFMKKAKKYDLECSDCTERLKDFPSCSFGLELDCKLLHLTVINKDDKKRKGDDNIISSYCDVSKKKKSKI